LNVPIFKDRQFFDRISIRNRLENSVFPILPKNYGISFSFNRRLDKLCQLIQLSQLVHAVKLSIRNGQKRKIMSRPKLAVATRCFGMPVKRAIQTAAQIRARGVQLDIQNEVTPTSFGASGDRHFRKLLEEFNLSVTSMRLPSRHALTEPEFLDQRVATVKSALEFAWRLQSPILIIHPGTIQTEEGGNFAIVCEVLNDLARFASHIGTDLCVACENNSPTVIRQLVSEVRSGLIGVEFDTAEMIFNNNHPEKSIRELHTWIKSYRVRDAIREMDKGGVEVPLGQGMVMWDQFLALISETGYQDWLTVDRTQGDQRVEDCRRAITYLESVLI